MKKCAHCGREHPDEAIRCVVDGELLPTLEPQAAGSRAETGATPGSPVPVSPTSEGGQVPHGTFSDRRMRVFEIVLLSALAFASSYLGSAYRLWTGVLPGAGTDRSLSRLNALLHEGASLGLLWYILMRRSKTFSDIGLSWRNRDFGVSILLSVASTIASAVVHGAIVAAGLSSASRSEYARVGDYLFGGGITSTMIIFAFVNPFFEELIVRAYVMTEVKALTGSAAIAIMASTLLQMGYHFYQGAPLAFSHGAAFLVFSIYYAKTKRIMPVILAHLFGDVGGALMYALRH